MPFYEQSGQPLRFSVGPTFSFWPHLHRQIECLWLPEGELELTIEGTPWRMDPGDLGLVWPNCVHSFRKLSPGRMVICVADLTCLPHVRSVFARNDCPRPVLTAAQLHPDVVWALRNVVTEPCPEPELQRAYLEVAVGRVLEALPLVPAGGQAQPDLLHAVLRYLSVHFREPLRLDELARALYVNKYTLSRVFSQQIGCSLRNYVNQLRVEAAQTELRGTTRSVAEVAEDCGFASERSFYRVFHELTGQSPAQYRDSPPEPSAYL